MTEIAFNEKTIESKRLCSLEWDGDSLVDWVSGGDRYELDGSVEYRHVNYAYPFDAAVVSPSGQYAAIFTSAGTTGLMLRHGEVLRQIHRDFYWAHNFRYPITFAGLPDGREALVHCPESYCRIEVEDAETGERLTASDNREPDDIFHSRLALSPDGRWLLSAGWVWHPLDVVHLYDLESALRDPCTLDGRGEEPPGAWGLSSASYVDPETIVIGTSDEFYGNVDDVNDDQPGAHRIALWTIGDANYSVDTALDHPPGELMALDHSLVVSMFEHPRLYDLQSGELVHEWKDIDCGAVASSITWDQTAPPIALDGGNARFAVGQESSIRVVEIASSRE